MASYHPGGRTGRIDQDPVVAPVTPDGTLRFGRVGRNDFGIAGGTLQVLAYPLQAFGVEVQCRDLQSGCTLQDVQSLATRRGAGVQDPLPGSDIEIAAGQLGPRVLHRHQTGGKARQSVHWQRRIQDQRRCHRGVRLCCNPDLAQPVQVLAATDLVQVDPQGHRRALLRGCGDDVQLQRPVRAECLVQPVRLREPDRRPLIDARLQGSPFTLQAAQHAVDQLAGPGLAEASTGLDRGRHRRMWRNTAVK